MNPREAKETPTDAKRDFLRHALATLAYRAARVGKDPGAVVAPFR